MCRSLQPVYYRAACLRELSDTHPAALQVDAALHGSGEQPGAVILLACRFLAIVAACVNTFSKC